MFDEYPTLEETLFAVQVKYNGPILNTAEIACRFGEMVLRRAKTPDAVQQQLPLTAIDQGDNWLISGAAGQSSAKHGPWQMTVCKDDCRIRFINDYSVRDPARRAAE